MNFANFGLFLSRKFRRRGKNNFFEGTDLGRLVNHLSTIHLTRNVRFIEEIKMPRNNSENATKKSRIDTE